MISPVSPRARDVIADLAACGRCCFTSSELRSALGCAPPAARQAVARLAAKGEVASPARGFYVIVPPEYRRLGCRPAEQFLPNLMAYRGISYYAALLTAAEYHGGAHHRPQEFQVAVGRSRPAILCGSVRVSYVARRNLAAVPVESFNTPCGTIAVSTVEATAVDLVGYMQRAGGPDRVAGLLSELGPVLDPQRLVPAAETAPAPWAQRLGYLLEFVGAGDRTGPLERHVARLSPHVAKLLPGAPAGGAGRSERWRLVLNAEIEPDA